MATENEKLRALLAEARIITQDSLDSNTTGFDEEFKVCHCDSCERYRSIIQRIDAALAEPVARLNPYSAAVAEMRGDAWQKQAMQRERERDEARAEVRRTYKELSESIAREAEAYERGAEAMRTAAMGAAWHSAAMGLHKKIQEMPVPEDTP